MTTRSGSLAGRLAWGAAILIAIALIVAGIGISLVLHHFIVGQIDQRLNEKIVSVSAALETGADGLRVRPGADAAPFDRGADAAPFDRAFSGWYWEVRDAGGVTLLRSASLADGEIAVFSPHFRWQEFWNLRPRPADGRGPRGEPLHLLIAVASAGGQSFTVIASAPGEAIMRPMVEALVPVFAMLALLGATLATASFLQVRLGLRPVGALRASIADIRAGRITHVPSGQPSELRPLADELNTLLDQNVEGLERARRNVANLAHALKTPLATLGVTLQQSAGAGDAAMLGHVAQMERHIRHHLGRARAAAIAGPVRARTEVAPCLADLAAMFLKVHADRNIAYSASVDAATAVACEKQDLDEMLGAIVDNAFKWARARVRVGQNASDRIVSILVEDDGAGLTEDQLPDALSPGRRLDETIPGDGFGLAIARELAELYNGGIDLGRSELGGLRVTITLPLARG